MTREGEERAGTRGEGGQLPCMTGTAIGIVELARHPPGGIAPLLQVVQHDPACVVALLTAAGRDPRARCASPRRAIERLGLVNALEVCLDFRLVDHRATDGVDYIRHWRHTLLTAAYVRAIAQRLRRTDQELLVTAALLRNLDPLLGGNRDDAGDGIRWLARQGISAHLCDLIQASHQPADALGEQDAAPACLLLGACMAEVWLRANWAETLWQARALAQRLFGAIPDLCEWLFGVLGPQADDLERLLKIRLPHRHQVEYLYRSARALRTQG